MEQESTREIQLGEHTYTVVAQRHTYLERKLGPRISEVFSLAGGDVRQLAASGSEGYHSLLSVFIPDLMPLWEWRGFASKTAFEQGEAGYDEDADKAPTLPQMVIAFRAAMDVNRLDLLEKLGGMVKDLVGPDFLKALRLRAEVEGTKLLANLGDTSSESLPPQSGEPPQTNGGTTPPTSVSSGVGPTPASSSI